MRVNYQSPFLLKSLPLYSEVIITARPRDNNLEPYSNLIELIRSKILYSYVKTLFSLLIDFHCFFIGRYFSVKCRRRQDGVTLMQFLEL